MLDLLGKLRKRLDELNDGSFEIEDRETYRVKNLQGYRLLDIDMCSITDDTVLIRKSIKNRKTMEKSTIKQKQISIYT